VSDLVGESEASLRAVFAAAAEVLHPLIHHTARRIKRVIRE
jgi:hypothetical protein